MVYRVGNWEELDIEDGPLAVDVRPNRAGSLAPVLLPKHEHRLTGFEDKVIACMHVA